jgi:hypothetical protein
LPINHETDFQRTALGEVTALNKAGSEIAETASMPTDL